MEPERIRRSDQLEVKLDLGMPVMIEPQGYEDKMRTYFIGMERKSYLIFALSPVINDQRRLFEYLYKGNRTKVFYTHEGVVNGVVSQIIMYTTAPFRHLYLTYPTDAEFCNLRGDSRTDSHVPCMLEGRVGAGPGMIVNISKGGCAISVDNARYPGSRHIEKGDILEVRFHLVHGGKECNTKLQVMNHRSRDKKSLLGCRFVNMDPALAKYVGEFIDYVLSYKI